MQLIFCDRCGRRISQQEIEGGRVHRAEGRAYCISCGVPASEPEAVKPSQETKAHIQPAPATVPVTASKRKKSGSSRLIQIKRQVAAEIEAQQEPEKSKSKAILLIAAGVAIICIPAGLIAFNFGEKRKTERVKQPVAEENAARPAPLPVKDRSPGPVVAEAKKKVIRTPPDRPPTPEEEIEAQKQLDLLVDKMRPLSETERIDLLHEFLGDFGHTKVSYNARTLLATLTGTKPPPPPPEDPPPPGTDPAQPPAPDLTTEIQAIPPNASVVAEPPPPPEPDPEDPKALQRAAWAAYRVNLLAYLRQRDARNAFLAVGEAQQHEKLKEIEERVALDRLGPEWLQSCAEWMSAGAQKLIDMPSFTIVMAKGDRLNVGKNGEFKVLDASGGALTLESKGMNMPLSLSLLSKETREQLVLMGLPQGGPGQLRKAFLEFFPNDPPKKAASFKEFRERLKQAQQAGADKQEVQWFLDLLSDADKGPLELAARQTWKDLADLEAAQEWKAARWLLKHFLATYAETAYGKGRQEEAAQKLEKTQQAVELREGYRFNFAGEENIARFKQVFSQTANERMEMTVEAGKTVFKRKDQAGRTVIASGTFVLRSPFIVLEKDWDLILKYTMPVTPANVAEAKGEKGLRFVAALFVRFMGAGETLSTNNENSHRLHTEMHSGFDGYMTFALRGPGQHNNGGGPPGDFEGASGVGFSGGGYIDKKPGAPDGKYEVKLAKRGERLVGEINGVPSIDCKLPAKALERIEKSPLTLGFHVLGKTEQMELELLAFRRIEK